MPAATRHTGQPSGPEVTACVSEYEDALRQIREVIAVRVVASKSGGIEEVHVLAGRGRGPKQIVRDIESALMAQFGVQINHKKISVAQVGEGPAVAWGAGRLRLVGVRLTTDTLVAETEVKVELDEVVHTGRAAGPASRANRLRLAAQATLSAVAEFFGPGYSMALDDVLLIEVRGRRVCLVVLTVLTPGGEETLVGSTLVRATEADAVARSVLDALNRRFTAMLRRPGARRTAPEGEASGGDRPD